MIDVYYPYYHGGARWHELQYSLRSIEKHFRFEYRVWLVGDKPDWIQNVMHIPHSRTKDIQENTTYDAVDKFLLYLEHPEVSCCVIRMYDDMYILKDVSLEEISVPKSMPGQLPAKGGVWMNQLRRTIEAVKKRGYAGINTETHCPERFDTKLMLEVIRSYDALNNRYLTSTLYHNTCLKPEDLVPISKDIAVQFYDGSDGIVKVSNSGNIAEKCQGKMFLNHNNTGLNMNLKVFLQRSFPYKSKFEK